MAINLRNKLPYSTSVSRKIMALGQVVSLRVKNLDANKRLQVSVSPLTEKRRTTGTGISETHKVASAHPNLSENRLHTYTTQAAYEL